jgi:hypothetical protein
MSFPSSPINGQIAVINNITYVYSSTTNSWTRQQHTFNNTGPVPPTTNLLVGDIWYNTNDDTVYRYTYDGTSYYWVDIITPTVTTSTTNLNFGVITSNTFTSNTVYANSYYYANGAVLGGGIIWASTKTANFTAVSGYAYPVNTTSGAVTVTLPASPVAGAIVTIVDYAGTALTNNIVIAPNGNKINSSTNNLTIAVPRLSYNLVYIDSTQGWISYAQQTSNFTYTASYLIVAGGGGSGYTWAGGGGGGGVLTTSATLISGTVYSITVGAGGAGSSAFSIRGSNGSNSSAFGAVAIGGGGGGSWDGSSSYPIATPTSYLNGASGGSGGGSGSKGSYSAPGTTGQGNSGGSGQSDNNSYDNGGGGGGAGASAANNGSLNGAIGISSTITGSLVYYAGGGGGGTTGTTGGTGGTGGGGAGTNGNTTGTSGTVNTGGGGGASNAAGGSGVVILSVPTANYSTVTTGSPTIVTNGSYTVMIFKSSGSYTA